MDLHARFRPLSVAAGRVLARPAAAGLLPWGPPHGDHEPPVTLSRDPARDAARRELSKHMYHEHDPGLFQRAVNGFWRLVRELLDSASGVTPGGGFGLLVIVLAVLALAGALWWRLGIPRRTRASAAALFEDRPRNAAEHRAAAEAHAAQGHWSRAVQERMRAVVRALEERALLDARPGRTADEAASEASVSLPAHHDRLLAAARDFDAITYGGRGGDADTYQRLTALDADLERTRPVLAAAGVPSGPADHAGPAAHLHADHPGDASPRTPE